MGSLLFFVGKSTGTIVPWLPIVGVVALAGEIAARTLAARPITSATPSTLIGAYPARLFLNAAISETTALVAFAAAFLGAPKWVYFLGGAALLQMDGRATGTEFAPPTAGADTGDGQSARAVRDPLRPDRQLPGSSREPAQARRLTTDPDRRPGTGTPTESPAAILISVVPRP